MRSMVAWSISSVSGMPATLLRRTSGTMVSPWPPITTPVTFSTETFSSCAMKVRKRALSSTPAMPITRFLLNLETQKAACAMASSGLVTTMMMQFGEYLATCSVAVLMTS